MLIQYRQTSTAIRGLVGNKRADHSGVDGTAPARTTPLFST